MSKEHTIGTHHVVTYTQDTDDADEMEFRVHGTEWLHLNAEEIHQLQRVLADTYGPPSHWRSAEDEPLEYGWYLCRVQYEARSAETSVERFSGQWVTHGGEVTHWQPLPAPPEDV